MLEMKYYNHITKFSCLYLKCRCARNDILHSYNYALDESTMIYYLRQMEDVLKCIPVSHYTTDALSNIEKVILVLSCPFIVLKLKIDVNMLILI